LPSPSTATVGSRRIEARAVDPEGNGLHRGQGVLAASLDQQQVIVYGMLGEVTSYILK